MVRYHSKYAYVRYIVRVIVTQVRFERAINISVCEKSAC